MLAAGRSTLAAAMHGPPPVNRAPIRSTQSGIVARLGDDFENDIGRVATTSQSGNSTMMISATSFSVEIHAMAHHTPTSNPVMPHTQARG
jgi:hypothetical protein